MKRLSVFFLAKDVLYEFRVSRLASLWLFKIITEMLIAGDTQTQLGEVLSDCEALNATVILP